MTIKEIKEREIKTIERYSKFIELVANSEVESANYFVDDILIENNSIPIIVTDIKITIAIKKVIIIWLVNV